MLRLAWRGFGVWLRFWGRVSEPGISGIPYRGTDKLRSGWDFGCWEDVNDARGLDGGVGDLGNVPP